MVNTLESHSLFERKLASVRLERAKYRWPVAFHAATTLPARVPTSLAHDLLLPKGTQKHAHGMRVAALFSGGPAAGGHNVLVGLAHVLKGNTLLGVHGGPGGLLAGNIKTLDTQGLHNTGGFDALGTDRTKIKTKEQFAQVKQVCAQHNIDALVVIGGDDSNTNAAFLAQALPELVVVGVPKTMDGDVQVDKYLPISFGFDTACKTYAELVGNICKDARSSQKYWHFVRLMGREASHVTLEVALQTQPTLAFISEEVAHKGLTLHHVVDEIVQLVARRAARGAEYGVVLVPEGLLEVLPDFKRLLTELEVIVQKRHSSLAWRSLKRRRSFLAAHLSRSSSQLYQSLPEAVQETLSLARDGHGNLKVSQIPTEQLLVQMVEHRLGTKVPFRSITHFFGYEGRCGAPSGFDAMLAYNLGLTAGSLVLAKKSGYMAGFTDLNRGGKPVGIPLAALLEPHADAAVIAKRLVRMDDAAFHYFVTHRKIWEHDHFLSPGPIQQWGPCRKLMPLCVALNQGYSHQEYKV